MQHRHRSGGKDGPIPRRVKSSCYATRVDSTTRKDTIARTASESTRRSMQTTWRTHGSDATDAPAGSTKAAKRSTTKAECTRSSLTGRRESCSSAQNAATWNRRQLHLEMRTHSKSSTNRCSIQDVKSPVQKEGEDGHGGRRSRQCVRQPRRERHRPRRSQRPARQRPPSRPQLQLQEQEFQEGYERRGSSRSRRTS